jgi:hypothetical protein
MQHVCTGTAGAGVGAGEPLCVPLCMIISQRMNKLLMWRSQKGAWAWAASPQTKGLRRAAWQGAWAGTLSRAAPWTTGT